jgi:hypothetical protein
MTDPLHKEILKQFEESIEAAYARHDLRGLRMVFKDTAEWARGLSIGAQRELDELLRANFGSGLVEEELSISRQIEEVLKRRKIRTQTEYEMLSRRADQIRNHSVHRDELEIINNILVAFHRSAKR